MSDDRMVKLAVASINRLMVLQQVDINIGIYRQTGYTLASPTHFTLRSEVQAKDQTAQPLLRAWCAKPQQAC
jgi:hypothetical protein